MLIEDRKHKTNKILHYVMIFQEFGKVTRNKVKLKPGPEIIKLFFMLSSAETKIYRAHKCKFMSKVNWNLKFQFIWDILTLSIQNFKLS